MTIQQKPPLPDESKRIERAVVGKGVAHDSATRHVRGEAVYIDDMADLPGTLHIAPVLSQVAKGTIKSIDTAPALALAGVKAVLTARDIPGQNEAAPILKDEPVLAEDKVEHVGQIIAAVVADTFATALQAARLVQVEIAEETPVFDVEEAFERNEHTHPTQHLIDGDFEGAFAAADHRFEGRLEVGGQDHF